MTTLTEKLAAERKAERAAVAREAAKREKAGQLIAAEEDRQRSWRRSGRGSSSSPRWSRRRPSSRSDVSSSARKSAVGR